MQRGVEERPGISILTKAQIAYNRVRRGYPLTGSIGRWGAVHFDGNVEREVELKRTKMVDGQRAAALNQTLTTVIEQP